MRKSPLTLMPKSSTIMCWFGLVWTFDFFAHVIEFRGFFKINVKKSVGKQIKIIKKTIKINQKYGKDDEKTDQNVQKETRTETYIKGSHILTFSSRNDFTV